MTSAKSLRLPALGSVSDTQRSLQSRFREKNAAAGRATSLSMVAGETPLSKPSADSGRALRRHRGAGPTPSRGLAASAPLAAPPRPSLLAEPRELGPHVGPREGRPAAGLHRRRPCSSFAAPFSPAASPWGRCWELQSASLGAPGGARPRRRSPSGRAREGRRFASVRAEAGRRSEGGDWERYARGRAMRGSRRWSDACGAELRRKVTSGCG